MYPEELIIPMKGQLTSNGFEDLTTADEVNEAMTKEGTTLVMVNSVCGCAAGAARPGVILSLMGETKKPDHLVTVFAGFDMEATERMRQYLMPFPPNSPSVALFKDGELVHMLERHHIEGFPAEMIAQNLKEAYDEFL